MTTNTETTNDEPAIYVGTYRKYNEGSIEGAWLTLSDYAGREDFLAACAELHADESGPELMFQDFENFPRAYYSESSAPPDECWEWLELDERQRAACACYLDHCGKGTTIRQFEEAYQGTYDDEADFAAELLEDQLDDLELPSWLPPIDWQAVWNCSLQYDYFRKLDDDGNMHFFYRH